MTKIPDAPKHIPITNDRYTAKEYEGLPEKTAEVAGHEPEHMAKVWGKVAGDGYISRADAGKLNRAMGDISVFGHELHDGTDTVEAEFMALRLSKSDVKWDPEVRKAYEGELAARNLQMEKGAVLTGSFTHEGTVHELTEGFVDMPYDKFLELMPADKWGVNLAEYRGGEVKITAKDEQGRVTRQRERMVLESPLSKLLPGVFEANDMTKVESITHGKDRTVVSWEVLDSDNKTTLKDCGELRFIRDGEKTKIEFESEHRVDTFPGVLSVLERFSPADKPYKAGTAAVLRNYITSCIETYQDIAAGKLKPR